MEKEEQLLKQGDAADVLLKSETFNNVVNSLVESTFQAFVNTKPEDGDNRERTYNHYRALVDIVNTLQQRVSVRDEIMNKRNNSEEE
jgi:hypothetical protein